MTGKTNDEEICKFPTLKRDAKVIGLQTKMHCIIKISCAIVHCCSNIVWICLKSTQSI